MIASGDSCLEPIDRGACYGYVVRSTMPLAFLRRGSGEPLEVALGTTDKPQPGDRMLVEWAPHSRHRLHARLYRGSDTYRLWVADGGWFAIDLSGPRIMVPRGLDPVRCQELLWAIPAALCLLHRGDLPLHAAAVEVDGGAIILAAPGGSGKTTLAAAFLQEGHGLLSEDLTCLQASPTPSVVPGPAMLRIRPDMMATLSLRGVQTLAVTQGRITLAFEEGRPLGTRPVPVRAIVFLRTSECRMTLERVPSARAIPDLWALTFQIPGDSDRARSFAGIVDAARLVPVWNLYRPFRADALELVVDRIIEASMDHA